jgi:hypothetical protein
MLKFTGKVASKSVDSQGTIKSQIVFGEEDMNKNMWPQLFYVYANLELGQIVTITIDSGTEEKF